MILRALLLVLVLVCATRHANAQCSGGQIANCPAAVSPQPSDVLLGYQAGQNPHVRKFSLAQVAVPGFPGFFASTYGVVADGSTSDDLALNAAITACSAVGGTLYLPAGRILLTGASSTTMALRNCHIVGAGNIAGYTDTTAVYGTTILLTSTTVRPFDVYSTWSFEGVNFYWPNQTTGLISYPPLFTCANGGVGCSFWYLDHVNIANAYDVFVSASPNGSGSWMVSNSYIYAVNNAFRTFGVGDTVHFSNVHFDPGTWLQLCQYSAPCKAAVDAAAGVNSIFYLTSGGALDVVISSSQAFAWRYGFNLQAGAILGVGSINMTWDAVPTVLDTSAGATVGTATIFGGAITSCYRIWFTSGAKGNAPCFNLGSAGTLHLENLRGEGAGGDWIRTTGYSVYVRGGVFANLGQALDGGDYYFLKSASGTGDITVTGATLSGISSSTKAHGIYAAGTPNSIVVQNNKFSYFNDVISTVAAPVNMVVTGNVSYASVASPTVSITGTNPVLYMGNWFDHPPTASVTSCGAGATVTGALNGVISVGSTNPTTSCTLTLPFRVYNSTGSGMCVFTSSEVTPLGASAPGPSPVWTISSGAVDIHGTVIWFNCPGQQ